MKFAKNLLSVAISASMLTFATSAFAEEAEETAMEESPVAASVAISNMYLWRGQDLGAGDLVVSGDLSYSTAGFHTGIWASSGDGANGQEYDLWLGYGGEAGDFTYDISVWNYIYPSTNVDFKELSEVILTLGFGDFSFSYYDNVAGSAGYRYITLSGQFGDWGVTLGNAKDDDTFNGIGVSTNENYTHLDVTYSYNENLSFTVSQVIDEEDDFGGNSDPYVQVSYGFPI